MEQDLISCITEAINKYGKNGDGSFECFGITLCKNQIIDKKAYRLHKAKNGEIINLYNNKNSFICENLECFLHSPYVELFDTSIKIIKHEKITRLNFQLDCNIPIYIHKELMCEFFKSLNMQKYKNIIFELSDIIEKDLSPNRSPIIQVGVGIKDNRDISEIKAYLTLSKYSGYTDKIGKKQLFEELKNVLDKIYNGLQFSNITKEYYHYVSSIFDNNHYYPTLIGINCFNTDIEYKLYYKAQLFGYNSTQIIENTNCLFEDLKINIDNINIYDLVCQITSLGLYLNGIALGHKTSGENNRYWKLYLFPMDKMKI